MGYKGYMRQGGLAQVAGILIDGGTKTWTAVAERSGDTAFREAPGPAKAAWRFASRRSLNGLAPAGGSTEEKEPSLCASVIDGTCRGP